MGIEAMEYGKFVDNGNGTFSLRTTVKAVAISTEQTRPNNITAYSANDVVGTDPATNMAFTNVASHPAISVVVVGARLRIDVAAIPSGMSSFRLHLYNAAPTAIADNAAFDLPAVDRGKYLGYVTLAAPVDLGSTLWSQEDSGLARQVKLATGYTSFYSILETIGAYTPTAGVGMTITLVVNEV